MILNLLEKRKMKKRNFIDCELNLWIEGDKPIKPERKLSKHDLRAMRELETALKMINDFQTNCLLMSIQKQIAFIALGMATTIGLQKQIRDTHKSLAKANLELSMLKSEVESELKYYYGKINNDSN